MSMDFVRHAATARRAAMPGMVAVCTALVRALYASWETRRAWDATAPEPNLTVAFVRAYLVQAGSVGGVAVPRAFADARYAAQYNMVRGGLETGVRAGTLERSVGCGAVRGRDAAAYAPAVLPRG